MKTARELLQAKGTTVWSTSPEATVQDALQLMVDRGIGALMVLDAGRVVGILSERDYVRKLALEAVPLRETPVRDIMTERVVFVRPEQTIEECMVLMTDKRVRHLPVLDGERLMGVVSIGDIVKALITEKDFTIQQLENYITGGAVQVKA